MDILKNIKIPTKIFCGFGIIIALMLIATVLGSISLTGANKDFDEYRALARQSNAVSRIQSNMLLTRIYAKNFVISADKSNIAMVHARANETTEAVAKANKLSQNPAYLKAIGELDSELHHYMDKFARVTELQAERNELVLHKLNVIGPATERALTQIMESAYKDGDLQASYWASKTMRNLLLARIYAARFLIQNDEASYDRSLKEFAALDINRRSLIKELDNVDRQQLAQKVTDNYRAYDAAFKKVHKIILERNNIIKNHLDRIGPRVAAETETLDLALKAKQDILGPLAEAEIDRATHVTIAVSILTFVLGISAACLIGAGIARPVVSMTNAMGELADGNTEVVIPATDHRDELGDMANALQIFKDNKIKANALAEHERIIQKQLADAHQLITQSINYSSSIQRAMLPDAEALGKIFRDHFVLWQPRDVVSGDFYWGQSWGDGHLFVLADCTGHGVPGAFMTLIAVGALERALLDSEPGQVGALIQRTHRNIQTALNQASDGGSSDDGVELGVCYIDADRSKLTFGGARFDLFVVHDGETKIFKSTKAGLGYRRYCFDQVFDETSLDIEQGTVFYMSSDGLIDQLGGEKRRSFGKKRFTSLLLDIQSQPLPDQATAIQQALTEYQGANTRQDDVAVVGFRL